MNQITKKKYDRSRPFRMSFLLGALFCAFLPTTEKAFSEIAVVAADLAWVAPPVLLASEDFGSVTPAVPPPGWSSTTTPITSSAAVATPRPRPTPRPRTTVNPTPTPILTPVLPTGVFSLTGYGRQIKGLSNPDVDGISIRDKWWHLEPSEGVYDWSTLDAYVAQITPTGKKILIRIGTMGGRYSLGGNTPDWVMDAVGANTISYYDSGHTLKTIPLFWNQTFLDKKKAMIAAWGANRLVIGKEIISDVMPFALPDPAGAWALFCNSRPAIAGQNLAACYGSCRMNGDNCNGLTYDQILRGSVDHFVSYGGKWLEIYADDVTNLPGAIHYAHGLIGH